MINEKLDSDDFVTEFNRRIFIDLTAMISCGLSNDITVLAERYTAEETSEIYKIKHENNDLPYSTERLNDYIAVLVAHRDKMNEKSVTDMSEDELRKFADSIKNKKS